MRNRMSGGVRGRRQKPSPTRSSADSKLKLEIEIDSLADESIKSIYEQYAKQVSGAVEVQIKYKN